MREYEPIATACPTAWTRDYGPTVEAAARAAPHGAAVLTSLDPLAAQLPL